MQSLLAAKPFLGTLAIEWANVTRLTKVLAPIVELTKKTQAAVYFVGDLLSDLHACRYILRHMDDSWSVKALECLEARTTPLTKTQEFMAALYLDPRYGNRQMCVLSEIEKTSVLVRSFIPY